MGKKEIRRKFRDGVFNRDGKCMVCHKPLNVDEMDAHHITDRNEMPNGGYVLENGITVCKIDCHNRVEEYHISNGKHWMLGLHPIELYQMINSSKEMAIEKSLEL